MNEAVMNTQEYTGLDFECLCTSLSFIKLSNQTFVLLCQPIACCIFCVFLLLFFVIYTESKNRKKIDITITYYCVHIVLNVICRAESIN